MAEGNRVILHGMWASPYGKRIEFALRMKGIEYEYVEEDLLNKSQLLLQLNPVHKKFPVLVHTGKTIVESLVILEYIDETWKDGPRLLPDDPYERAKVRFWANFLQQQLFDTMTAMVISEGEAQKRAIEQVHEKLKLLEEGMRGGLPGGFPSITGEHKEVGLLDIVMCSILGPHKVYEEIFDVKFIDPEKHPLITSWLKSLAELPLVKEVAPSHENYAGFVRFFRQKALEILVA